MQAYNLDKEQIKEMFLEAEQSCSLCGSNLTFSHNIDHVKKEVVEEACCKMCGIKNKKRQFALQ
jgi:C4-type Zn-finger protein